MNFVLHHHLALRDLGRSEAALGAMLPDVWRMADRHAHARAPAVPTISDARADDADVVGLLAHGVVHHLNVDAWFHRANVFMRGELAARDALRRTRNAPKAGLFAHIAWELCLDGALLRRHGSAAVLEVIRPSVSDVPPHARRRAVDVCTTLTIDRRDVFDPRVEHILDSIARGPWVEGYASAPGIVERLEGVRARLGFSAMDPDDRGALETGLEALKGQADAGLEEILQHGPFAG